MEDQHTNNGSYEVKDILRLTIEECGLTTNAEKDTLNSRINDSLVTIEDKGRTEDSEGSLNENEIFDWSHFVSFDMQDTSNKLFESDRDNMNTFEQREDTGKIETKDLSVKKGKNNDNLEDQVENYHKCVNRTVWGRIHEPLNSMEIIKAINETIGSGYIEAFGTTELAFWAQMSSPAKAAEITRKNIKTTKGNISINKVIKKVINLRIKDIPGFIPDIFVMRKIKEFAEIQQYELEKEFNLTEGNNNEKIRTFNKTIQIKMKKNEEIPDQIIIEYAGFKHKIKISTDEEQCKICLSPLHFEKFCTSEKKEKQKRTKKLKKGRKRKWERAEERELGTSQREILRNLEIIQSTLLKPERTNERNSGLSENGKNEEKDIEMQGTRKGKNRIMCSPLSKANRMLFKMAGLTVTDQMLKNIACDLAIALEHEDELVLFPSNDIILNVLEFCIRIFEQERRIFNFENRKCRLFFREVLIFAAKNEAIRQIDIRKQEGGDREKTGQDQSQTDNRIKQIVFGVCTEYVEMTNKGVKPRTTELCKQEHPTAKGRKEMEINERIVISSEDEI